MSLFGLKFSQMILHTETSKLMYNWSFLFEVLHKPTLLPSTFNILVPFITKVREFIQPYRECIVVVWMIKEIKNGF